MADISITAASVLKSSQGQTAVGIAGTTITAGQALYIDTADSNKLKLADSDGTSPSMTVAGISQHAALAGQPINYLTQDPAFAFGGTVLAGDPIYLSDTPGGLTKTFGDLEAGDTVVVLGVAVTTTTMNLRPLTGGVIA